MTSPNNHDDILDTLKSILGFIKWIGVPIVGVMSAGVAIMVTDHYSQQTLEKDRDFMKPKVTKLWLEKHPDANVE
jgi:hypothetical protein